MGNIDKFCDSMYHWCAEMDMHYGQGNSDFPLSRYDFRYGGSTDCSAMVAHCLREAGWDVPEYIWSGNTAEVLLSHGWVKSFYDGLPQKRGSVLINTWNHVAVWDGSRIIEFGGDPHYGYNTVHGFYDYPWDCYMYPPEDSSYDPQPEPGDGVTYEVHTADGWLGAVSKADETEDGYAGWNGKPIDGIRCYKDGGEIRVQAIMDNGDEFSTTTFNGSMWGENADSDGYAGDIGSGHYIIGLRVFGARCRVKAGGGWLGWTEGDNPTPEGDDFAGEDLWKKQPITAVQMKL